MSISCIVKNNYNVNFKEPKCYVVNKNGDIILNGNLTSNGVYKLNV